MDYLRAQSLETLSNSPGDTEQEVEVLGLDGLPQSMVLGDTEQEVEVLGSDGLPQSIVLGDAEQQLCSLAWDRLPQSMVLGDTKQKVWVLGVKFELVDGMSMTDKMPK